MKRGLRREYCTCVEVRNLDYDEAADRLKCNKRWLQDNISRLPHQKYGASAVFCNCELALIQALFTVFPDAFRDAFEDAPEPENEDNAPAVPLALTSLVPSRARGTRRAS